MSGSPQPAADSPQKSGPGVHGAPAPKPTGRRAGVILGALLAAGASAGLAWWLGTDDGGRRMTAQDAPSAVEAPAPRRQANPAADPEQVRRAYAQFQDTYADGGLAALVRFSQTCMKSLTGDPRLLDFCLAFDMYAASVAPPAQPWFQDADARRLALSRAALPAASDPQGRIGEVQRLMRTISGAGEAPSALPGPQPVASPAERPAPAAPTLATAKPVRAHAKPSGVRRAAHQAAARPHPSLAKVRHPAKTRSAKLGPGRYAVRGSGRAAPIPAACRFGSTPADRVLCASPKLRAADRQMHAAYARAIAGGANRRALGRDQRRWRTARNAAAPDQGAVAELYARRIEELQQVARQP